MVIFAGYVYQATKDNPLVVGKNKPPTDQEYWKRYDSIADVTVDHETRIIQNTDEITLRATKAEVKSDVDQINSVMTSTFSVQAAAIDARVTKTDFYPTQQLAKDNAAQLTVHASQIQSKVSQTTFDLLKGNVATVSSQVDQIADAWTVKIQSLANGQKAVTGIDLALNDGTGQSQFIVLADNFRVAANVNGSPVGLFAVSGNGVYINGTLYAPGSIQAGHLAANSVTADKIVGGTITGDKIAGSTITGANIRARSLWADEVLIDGTLSASKIAAGSITADKIAADTIDARVLKQNGIPIDKIMTGVILQVATGATSCTLTQPGTHVYIATSSGFGRGQMLFSSSVGSQGFSLSNFYGSGGEDAYPMLHFAITKAGHAGYSTASWNAGSGVNLDAASIIGFVVK